MTRFARAKGSKASNEKTPEDSTPWEVMKDQLLQAKKEKDDSKNRELAEKQRIENYENFLKENKVQKRKATWFDDFPEAKGGTTNSELATKKKKKKNKKKAENGEVHPDNTVKDNVASDNAFKKKKKNNVSENLLIQNNDNETSHSNEADTQTELNIDRQDANAKSGKKQKKNKKKDTKMQLEQTETNEVNVDNSNEKSFNKKKKNKQVDKGRSEPNNDNSNTVMSNINGISSKPIQAVKKKKEKKLVDGKPVRRKDVNDKSFELIINGKEVELVRVDGFPVMKKDAERLKELKASMLQKGIPKSEIQRTMKLERRRAEKALARMKREVCYNCRKGGHNLSDCPDLKSKIPGVDAAEGVCFKCGSTEHRQFECKVQRDKEFRFATCFICKEPGHIARQCPDNPKGLYPNGGCCKLCGDVTHLRKDCPTVSEKKEEKSIKLQTLDSSGDLEGIGQSTNTMHSDEQPKKAKKIKF